MANGTVIDVEHEAYQDISGWPFSSSDFLPELKRIDFVLVYRNAEPKWSALECEKMQAIRSRYEENLAMEGLYLKRVAASVGDEVCYVHIYAPWDVLTRYAEIMSFRMPMKTIRSNLKILFDQDSTKGCERFTTVFSRDKQYLFDIPTDEPEDFFSPSQRAEIVDYILKRTRFKDKSDVFSIGINKLITDQVYVAAYPLHDVTVDCKRLNCGAIRCELSKHWASLGCILRLQPLERIVKYFGVKIAMYYAWVGFYTVMLVPASVMGVLTLIYGASTMERDTPIQEVCTHPDDILMCPACALNCTYTHVTEHCFAMKVSHVSGNLTTVVFAVFISLWATIYLEMWKRYSAQISHRWDLSDFNHLDEYPRPEFLANLSRSKVKTRRNAITNMEEPYVPFVRGRLPYFVISFSFVSLCISLALLIMVSIIVYRVSIQIALLAQHQHTNAFIVKYGEIIVTVTAACINLACILLLSIAYKKFAYFLTEAEMPRTQNEFDNSLTLKMYLFEFVNYYSSFFYIAFFKGRLVSDPPDGSLRTDKRNYFLESCPLGGCYLDLTIQLAIIFVGKALINTVLEYGTPYLQRVWNRHRYLNKPKSEAKTMTREQTYVRLPQWEEDFLLEGWDHMSLFYEYLKLVIQFGFVTIFVSAFPLAPLLALVNNVFEIRFDARKMLTNFKRPVAQRVKDIGIWYGILDAVGKLSVFTNSMIIAFTTDIIPQLMYYTMHRADMHGYMQWSSSVYNITASDPPPPSSNHTHCLYNAFREPPWEPTGRSYRYTEQHWHVLVAKIVFVIIFQNVVAALNSALKAFIPDEPKKLRMQKRQHLYLTNEMIIRHELKSRKRAASSCNNASMPRNDQRAQDQL